MSGYQRETIMIDHIRLSETDYNVISFNISFYGIQLLNLFGNDIKDIFVSWRKALRCIWNLHPQTHGDLLAVISGLLPVQISFYNDHVRIPEADYVRISEADYN